MARSILILFLALCSVAAYAQVPKHVTAERLSTDDTVLVRWSPLPAGVTVNTFIAKAPPTGCDTLPAPTTPDATGVVGEYADNPNPGWDALPLSGNWKERFWCYWVNSSADSTKIGPFFVAIGETGYLGMTFASNGPDPNNPCASAPIVPLLSTNPADYEFHSFYRDAAGVDHEMEISRVIIGPSISSTKTFAEIEWKLPGPDKSHTFIVPWDAARTYYGTFKYIPSGQTYPFSWAPTYGKDHSYYNQAGIRVLVSNPKVRCPMSETNLWENVINN